MLLRISCHATMHTAEVYFDWFNFTIVQDFSEHSSSTFRLVKFRITMECVTGVPFDWINFKIAIMWTGSLIWEIQWNKSFHYKTMYFVYALSYVMIIKYLFLVSCISCTDLYFCWFSGPHFSADEIRQLSTFHPLWSIQRTSKGSCEQTEKVSNWVMSSPSEQFSKWCFSFVCLPSLMTGWIKRVQHAIPNQREAVASAKSVFSRIWHQSLPTD